MPRCLTPLGPLIVSWVAYRFRVDASTTRPCGTSTRDATLPPGPCRPPIDNNGPHRQRTVLMGRVYRTAKRLCQANWSLVLRAPLRLPRNDHEGHEGQKNNNKMFFIVSLVISEFLRNECDRGTGVAQTRIGIDFSAFLVLTPIPQGAQHTCGYSDRAIRTARQRRAMKEVLPKASTNGTWVLEQWSTS